MPTESESLPLVQALAPVLSFASFAMMLVVDSVEPDGCQSSVPRKLVLHECWHELVLTPASLLTI